VSFRYLWRVLGTVGDLVEDVVVSFSQPMATEVATPAPGGSDSSPSTPIQQFRLSLGSDTTVAVERRQGGSAANVAVAVADLGRPARFIGQIGDDALGRSLEQGLWDRGVEPVLCRRGRTGSVIVLCHPDGERSMLTDRGSSRQLDQPDSRWLDGLALLHVPLYSLAEGPLAATTATLVAWAHQRGLVVSLDLSSTALMAAMGAAHLMAVIGRTQPHVVLANEAEAAAAAELRLDLHLGGRFDGGRRPARTMVVKRGGRPAHVYWSEGACIEVPALVLGPLSDTTGAGDAFAAGLLTALIDGADPAEAANAGHHSAAARLQAQHR
jgi:sugar/nucleoside kinase (ribokinase family)